MCLLPVSDLCQTPLVVQECGPSAERAGRISLLCLQRFKSDLQSGIPLQRPGCFPVNVSSQNLHFTKTVLCKHILSHFTCCLLNSKSLASGIHGSLGSPIGANSMATGYFFWFWGSLKSYKRALTQNSNRTGQGNLSIIILYLDYYLLDQKQYFFFPKRTSQE